MNFQPRILNAKQKRLLKPLGSWAASRGFYLAGGTALALMLGHRQSVDFDFFTQQNIPDPLRLVTELQDAGFTVEPQSVAPDTLLVTISQVKASFITYRYRMLEEYVDYPAYDLKLASLSDIAAMKLAAIAQRGARKDFIDCCALIRNTYTLPQMLQFYREKFGFKDVTHVLYGLAYFEDAEREPMPKMLLRTSWKQVKQEIQAAVKTIGLNG